MLIITLLCLSALAGQAQSIAEYDDAQFFTNVWAVHIESDNSSLASEIAAIHGFTSKGRIADLPGYFKFVHSTVKPREENSADHITTKLQDHQRVHWVEQQRILPRTKRDLLPLDGSLISRQTRKEVGKRLFNDKEWPNQWYLLNYGQLATPLGNDINVLPVWQRGLRGQGMVACVVDTGMDHTNPDLKDNYDPAASFDFVDDDPDPFPDVSAEGNAHGTECAGEIGASANNAWCGVGVAPMVNLGAVRFLDDAVTDHREAESFSFQRQYIDVYSNSWGPDDDGKTFAKPGTLAKLALEKGVKEGRGGKGSIFVWAAGNGGVDHDDCNADGYASSIYTVSISSVSSYGLSSYYTERCASTAAVVYTGDPHSGYVHKPLVTTALHGKCTSAFSGTSSAAPIAAGIITLILQGNPQLTWRDVQHLIVQTAKKTSELDEGWKKNAVGIEYNDKFGFGLLDAGAMLDAALKWTNVPDQRVCETDGSMPENSNIPSRGEVVLQVTSDACKGTPNFIKTLEHVEVVLSVEHRRRGDMSINVCSPSGTKDFLLYSRSRDYSDKGLKDWPFTTIHLWGENPAGEWFVTVADNGQVEESKVDMENVEGLIIAQEVMEQQASQSAWLARQSDSSDDDDEKLVKARKMYNDLHTGRFKGDYMENLEKDMGGKSSVVGRVLNWKIVLYGTA